MNFRLAPDFSRVEKEHSIDPPPVVERLRAGFLGKTTEPKCANVSRRGSRITRRPAVKIPPVSPLSQRGEKPPMNHESGFSPPCPGH
jgi:hypothetical protein